MRKTKLVSFRLPEKLIQQMDEAAMRMMVSRSALLRLVLNHHLNKAMDVRDQIVA